MLTFTCVEYRLRTLVRTYSTLYSSPSQWCVLSFLNFLFSHMYRHTR
jgi:hypothetical protein